MNFIFVLEVNMLWRSIETVRVRKTPCAPCLLFKHSKLFLHIVIVVVDVLWDLPWKTRFWTAGGDPMGLNLSKWGA